MDAWDADTRFSAQGREVIGAAMAWRQADAFKDAGIRQTYALSPVLAMIDSGEFKANLSTVLVLDEASQIGPRPLLELFELQAKTGLTIKMFGDREQAQTIEAGDSIEILRRALPPEALPELLTTMRQATHRGREIAGLFCEGEAAQALNMKRADGHAMMVGGDRDQVVAQIANFYIARRDILLGSRSERGINVSAPTTEDGAEISQAIRQRFKVHGELGCDETLHLAIDQGGQEYDLALAAGDRVRLFRRTWGTVDGSEQQVGNNGDVVEVLAQNNWGLRIRTKEGEVADVEWRRLADRETGRLMLAFGHALNIDAARGITSDEHINALPRGRSGVTPFTTYVAESCSRGATWTVISEGALTRRNGTARCSVTSRQSPTKTSGRGPPRTCRRSQQGAGDRPPGQRLAKPGTGRGCIHRHPPHHGSGAVQRPLRRPEVLPTPAARCRQREPGASSAGARPCNRRERRTGPGYLSRARSHRPSARASRRSQSGRAADGSRERQTFVRSRAVRSYRPGAVIPAPRQRHENWAAAAALDGSL